MPHEGGGTHSPVFSRFDRPRWNASNLFDRFARVAHRMVCSQRVAAPPGTADSARAVGAGRRQTACWRVPHQSHFFVELNVAGEATTPKRLHARRSCRSRRLRLRHAVAHEAAQAEFCIACASAGLDSVIACSTPATQKGGCRRRPVPEPSTQSNQRGTAPSRIIPRDSSQRGAWLRVHRSGRVSRTADNRCPPLRRAAAVLITPRIRSACRGLRRSSACSPR